MGSDKNSFLSYLEENFATKFILSNARMRYQYMWRKTNNVAVEVCQYDKNGKKLISLSEGFKD